MNSYKLGLCTLSVYVLMSIASWAIADGLPNIYILTLFFITSIISTIMWYAAIRKGMTKSIKDGVIVSMFFIIPYGIIALTTYKALFRDELRDILKLVIWLIFSNPMRIANYFLSDNVNLINFSVFEPFLIIGILLLLNLIPYLFKNKKTT